MSGPYLKDEFLDDIHVLNPETEGSVLTELLASECLSLAPWMSDHGVRWQKPLRGTLHLSRTNRFFLGGGKNLVNAYYRTAEKAGIEVHYDTQVVGFDLTDGHCNGVVARTVEGERFIECDAVVVAAGGFEANLAWLAESWGEAASNFIVRGTPFNDGAVLRLMLDAGAEPVGDPSRFHSVAVDARSPKVDGGIVTRLDTIPVGIVVNRGGERFYDEGEDLWPKRYAQWGRLIAQQPGQIAFSILDAQRRHSIMPPVFPPYEAPTIAGLAELIGIEPGPVVATVDAFNAHVRTDREPDLGTLDGCSTLDLVPPKSNWALPLDHPPFIAFPLRAGITFTYGGIGIEVDGRVQRSGGTFDNVYAAGEIMAGNIMTRGYVAGIGMTVGSVFGRVAGRGAATHA